MLNAETMLLADAILTAFDPEDWAGEEFSERYVQEYMRERPDVEEFTEETFDQAVEYLCLVGLLQPTAVKRRRQGRDRFVGGLRVAR